MSSDSTCCSGRGPGIGVRPHVMTSGWKGVDDWLRVMTAGGLEAGDWLRVMPGGWLRVGDWLRVMPGGGLGVGDWLRLMPGGRLRVDDWLRLLSSSANIPCTLLMSHADVVCELPKCSGASSNRKHNVKAYSRISVSSPETRRFRHELQPVSMCTSPPMYVAFLCLLLMSSQEGH